MPNNNDIERTDWDNITKEDLEVLAHLKQFIDQEKEREKEKLRALRKIWDPAFDLADAPEIFGYNIPIE